MNNLVVTYAQNREDVILAGFFGSDEKGFYVDIGAHDPRKDSVTKYFYDRGWTGMNVEPNPRLFKKLVDDRPRDVNVNMGIAEKSGELTIRIYDKGDGLSTFSDDVKKQYSSNKTTVTTDFTDKKVQVITLKELFETHKIKHISFLKMDIEGFEYNALIGNDWKKYRPEVLCIEANHIVKDWRPLLRENGYESVFFDGLNEYFVAQESKKRFENFSYVQSIIGRNIVSDEVARVIEENSDKVDAYKYLIAKHRKRIQELEEREQFLQAHIFEQSKMKNLIKTIIIKIDRFIVRQLEKNTKKPYYYPQGNLLTRTDSPLHILHDIQEADKKAFEGKVTIGWSIRVFLGTGLMTIYRLVRKGVGTVLRWLYRSLLKPILKRA